MVWCGVSLRMARTDNVDHNAEGCQQLIPHVHAVVTHRVDVNLQILLSMDAPGRKNVIPIA